MHPSVNPQSSAGNGGLTAEDSVPEIHKGETSRVPPKSASSSGLVNSMFLDSSAILRILETCESFQVVDEILKLLVFHASVERDILVCIFASSLEGCSTVTDQVQYISTAINEMGLATVNVACHGPPRQEKTKEVPNKSTKTIKDDSASFVYSKTPPPSTEEADTPTKPSVRRDVLLTLYASAVQIYNASDLQAVFLSKKLHELMGLRMNRNLPRQTRSVFQRNLSAESIHDILKSYDSFDVVDQIQRILLMSSINEGTSTAKNDESALSGSLEEFHEGDGSVSSNASSCKNQTMNGHHHDCVIRKSDNDQKRTKCRVSTHTDGNKRGEGGSKAATACSHSPFKDTEQGTEDTERKGDDFELERVIDCPVCMEVFPERETFSFFCNIDQEHDITAPLYPHTLCRDCAVNYLDANKQSACRIPCFMQGCNHELLPQEIALILGRGDMEVGFQNPTYTEIDELQRANLPPLSVSPGTMHNVRLHIAHGWWPEAAWMLKRK